MDLDDLNYNQHSVTIKDLERFSLTSSAKSAQIAEHQTGMGRSPVLSPLQVTFHVSFFYQHYNANILVFFFQNEEIFDQLDELDELDRLTHA